MLRAWAHLDRDLAIKLRPHGASHHRQTATAGARFILFHLRTPNASVLYYDLSQPPLDAFRRRGVGSRAPDLLNAYWLNYLVSDAETRITRIFSPVFLLSIPGTRQWLWWTTRHLTQLQRLGHLRPSGAKRIPTAPCQPALHLAPAPVVKK